MKYSQHLKGALCALFVPLMVACGGGGGMADLSASNGTIRYALTDAPSCGYDAVNVTVQKVRIHQSSTAAETDGGWSEVILNPAKRVDLLTLTNGVLSELGQTSLPAGKYTQIRFVLASNDSTNPLANSVVPTGGTETALKSPSGQQSGIKANVNVDVASNKTIDLVIDFDACKSIVSAGNSGQYILKPVINIIPRYLSGVSGSVDASLVSATTSVSVQQAGVVVRSTSPDSAGKFLLQPVPPGNYTLVLTAAGRSTMVITGVPVATETVTAVNASTAPLTLSLSSSGTLNGTAPLETLVRVLQPLTVGTTIEVTGHFVDNSGHYSYVVPVGAPSVAAYAVSPAALAFSSDTAAAAKYTLNASFMGFADKTVALGVLGSTTTITSNFTFP